MKKRTVFIFILIVFILQGCATPAQIDKMTVSSEEITQSKTDSPLHDNINLNSVNGGQATNPLWTSEIGNSEFATALEQSLRAANLLEGNEGSAKYILDVNILRVDQPIFGAGFTVTASVHYKLTEKSTDKIVFNEAITKGYTAKLSDSLIGVKRLRLANEGAAKSNISEFLTQLHNLQLDENDN